MNWGSLPSSADQTVGNSAHARRCGSHLSSPFTKLNGNKISVIINIQELIIVPQQEMNFRHSSHRLPLISCLLQQDQEPFPSVTNICAGKRCLIRDTKSSLLLEVHLFSKTEYFASGGNNWLAFDKFSYIISFWTPNIMIFYMFFLSLSMEIPG